MTKGKPRRKLQAQSSEEKTPEKQLRKKRKMADAGREYKGEKVSKGTVEEKENISSYLQTIAERLDSVDNKLDGLYGKNQVIDEVLNGDGGIIQEFEGAKEILGETQADVSTLRDMVTDNNQIIRILAATVDKQFKDINSIKAEMEDLKNRGMRDNVLFHNVPEKQNEDVRDAVMRAFRHVKEVGDIRYDRIHRLGPPAKDRKPRPIVAKPSDHQDKERLLQIKRPRGQKTSEPWISPQYSESLRERRAQLAIIAQEARKKDPTSTTKLYHTKLTINGQVVNPPLGPVSPAEIQLLPIIEKEELQAINKGMVQTATISHKGTSFIAKASTVRNISQVRMIQKAVLVNPESARAAHNIVAYILPNGDPGYYDDDDYGMGRRMLQAMQQREQKGVVVVVTRYHRSKLGSERFEVIRDITHKACELLHDANKRTNESTQTSIRQSESTQGETLHSSHSPCHTSPNRSRKPIHKNTDYASPRSPRSTRKQSRGNRNSCRTQSQPPTSSRVLRSCGNGISGSQDVGGTSHVATDRNNHSVLLTDSGTVTVEVDPMDIHSSPVDGHP